MNRNTDELKRTFNFGKIAYYPTSRKSNSVEVTIRLYTLENGVKAFSACGAIWNCRHTDQLSGGQNLDEIKKWLGEDALFNEIFDLWKKYHLNDLNSGTKRQYAALVEESNRRNAEHEAKKEALEKSLTSATRYEDACKYLKSIGLFIDKLGEGEVLQHDDKKRKVTSNHYPYGHGWVAYTIPENDLKRIMSLIDNGEVWKE